MSNRELTLQRKRPERPRLGRGVELNVKCGQCIHFKRTAYYSQICIQLGVTDHSIPCRAFKADPGQIDLRVDGLTHAARIMARVQTKQLQQLAALLQQEANNRRQGYTLGQLLYFRAEHSGPDHLSDYVAGRVVSSDNQHVWLQGAQNYLVRLLHRSVLTREAFEIRRAELQQLGRLRNPTVRSILLKALAANNWLPPSVVEEKIKRKRGPKRQTIKVVVKPITSGKRGVRTVRG